MAQQSWPFDGGTTTETQYSRLFREFQESGVIGDFGSNQLQVFANATGMQVYLRQGLAIIRGHAYHNTSQLTIPIDSASGSRRIDLVVLELNPTGNQITAQVLKGTPGSTSAPNPTQTDTGVYQIPLAEVDVAASAVSIGSNAVTDLRPWVGGRIGAWRTATRPSNPRRYQFGFNNTTNRLEYYNGNNWDTLDTTWSNLTGKPSTFPPSSHTHTWSQIASKPTSFPPSSHTHTWSQIASKPTSFPPSSHSHTWGSITGKPSKFPPSSHSHSWSSITGKPSTFKPSSHTHNGSDITGRVPWASLADRANGSDGPHQRSVSGPGPWYSAWVRADGVFCRNTSSIRYKENVRSADISADALLGLDPKVYDRKDTIEDGKVLEGRKDEFGLIAEEVYEVLPEVVTLNEDGTPEAIRYDLLAVAAIPALKALDARVKALEGLLGTQT